MNVDPVELFGEELMTRGARDQVIEQLQRLPVSAAIKRSTFARWAELVNYQATEVDFRRAQRLVPSLPFDEAPR